VHLARIVLNASSLTLWRKDSRPTCTESVLRAKNLVRHLLSYRRACSSAKVWNVRALTDHDVSLAEGQKFSNERGGSSNDVLPLSIR